ncbi:hypothetical protein SADUNF_Sadunf16G0092800 [Salix dunnii]|uniref:Uncharacterized protein n=1 Tax=Salix dunnii TaxID=1413687 RepID=A0A835J8S5_9ROSI|nr:hypothetical protein SADUNF_Sadunf16G0092800 [Salix dunnii]
MDAREKEMKGEEEGKFRAERREQRQTGGWKRELQIGQDGGRKEGKERDRGKHEKKTQGKKGMRIWERYIADFISWCRFKILWSYTSYKQTSDFYISLSCQGYDTYILAHFYYAWLAYR